MTACETVVVGAGMAGIACARALADAGHPVLVLDKGRAIGGRIATRVTRAGWRFDHGAQYVRSDDPDLNAFLQTATTDGHAASWTDETDLRCVGMPGMRALVAHLAGELEVRQSVEISAIEHDGAHFVLTAEAHQYHCTRLVVTAPAPQIPALVGPDDPVSGQIANVRYAPCLTLMAAFKAGVRTDAPDCARDPTDEIGWIARDSSKPGREGATWVAQANPAWSAAHLERDKAEIADLMLPKLCAYLDVPISAVVYQAAHRWRYAHVVAPLGQPFIGDQDGRRYFGGDWCLGPRIDAAWQSGRAIAKAMAA